MPGVPDVYQGTELWEDSLVDPDNRRPVDYDVRRAELDAAQHPKFRVVQAALQLRRDRPETFLTGGYTPALAAGSAAEHIVAFLRGDDVAGRGQPLDGPAWWKPAGRKRFCRCRTARGATA